MKKIVCELCGESDFVKNNGAFECQVCGAKYSVAEAKKLFVDVDEDGNIYDKNKKVLKKIIFFQCFEKFPNQGFCKF